MNITPDTLFEFRIEGNLRDGYYLKDKFGHVANEIETPRRNYRLKSQTDNPTHESSHQGQPLECITPESITSARTITGHKCNPHGIKTFIHTYKITTIILDDEKHTRIEITGTADYQDENETRESERYATRSALTGKIASPTSSPLPK